MGWVLFDWGDTLMVDFPEYDGPMATWPQVEAVSGAREVLQHLRHEGWRTALATNAADSEEPEIKCSISQSSSPGPRVVSDPHAEGFYRRMGARRVGEQDSVPEGRRLPVLLLNLET